MRSFAARFTGSMRSTSGLIGTSAPKAMPSSGSHGIISGALSITQVAISRPADPGEAERSMPARSRSMVDTAKYGVRRE